MSTIGRVLHARCPTRVFVVFSVVAISSMGAVPARAQPSGATTTADTTTSADTAAKPDSLKPAAAPNGICLNCGPSDNPPTVAITPGTGTFGTGTQTVTIDWCDDNALAASSRQITFNGIDVTAQFTYTNVTPSSCGDEAKSVGTFSLRTGSNSIAAQIRDGAAQLGSALATYTYTPLVIVTPDSATRTSYATIRDTAVFTVKNPTAGSVTYTLSTTCPTGWMCSAPPSLPVAAGVSTNVNVAYTPTISHTTGSVILTATPPAGASSADAGTFHVTVPITVNLGSILHRLDMEAYAGIRGTAYFTVWNSGPRVATYSLSGVCSAPGASACTIQPNVTVAAGATMLVPETFTPGDSGSTGHVGLTATGGDGGNVATLSLILDVGTLTAGCDTSRTVTGCFSGGGDLSPPLIVIRPDQMKRNVRTDTLVIDYCDNNLLSNAGIVTLNGAEVTPQFPDSDGNTTITCAGGGRAHERGALTLLPGGNSVSAYLCDDAGNCSEGDAGYEYTVLDIATADSAQLRRGAGSTFTQKFRVTNIGHETYTYTLSASCAGTGVTACAMLGPTSVTLNANASVIDSVSYQTSTTAGLTAVVSTVASPVLNPGWSASGSVNVRTITPVPLLGATPDSAHVPAADSLSNTYDFRVRNLGNVRESLTFSATCTGLTSCSVSPTSKVMAPNDSLDVRATYTAGAIGSSGTLVLNAASGDASDHATILVTAQLKNLPVVSLDSVWAPGRIERSLCVTAALGTGGAADGCGDLRVAVAASAVRTLGETRAPTLLYGSADALASVVVPVRVGFLQQATIPDSVTAALVVGGVIRDSGKWVKAQWAAGATRQIALAIDGRTLSGGPGGATDHTGVYAATLQITSYTGATRLADTLSTSIPVVDRSQSAFGAGWWLAGLERLYFPTDGTLTWVGGDGSLRTYTKDPAHTSIYRAPSLTRLDSLVKDAGGQYIRYLPNRLHVRFNSAGQHIATITRLGDSTVFAYNASGQLQTITVAPVSAGKTYTFSYDASGRLSTIAAPLGGSSGTTARVTTLVPVGTTRQIASATFADGSVVHLTYDGAHVGRILTSTDARGTTTTFVYDSAGKLSTSTIGMQGVTPDLVTHLTTSASLGFRGTVAVDTSVVATRIDGPRTDVGDTTVIRVTALGAPRKITDALGHVTVLQYRNGSFPALVTNEHRLDVAASVATYDAKGHLTAETDSTTYVDDTLGTRTFATTTYGWDAIWDQVDTIAPPLADSTVITHNASNGNRLTQRDVVGDTVFYGYNSSGRLVSVSRATHGASDSLTYDALGNVASTITPLGYVTTDFRDATGRDTLVKSPIDAGQTLFASSRTVYDIADRPTLTQSFGPAVIFPLPALKTDTAPPETLTVVTVYDAGGLVRRVKRTAEPDTAHLDSLVTRMGYDPAGRKVADTATDGAVDTYQYDADGHLTQHVTRDALTVSYQYDVLGELTTRAMNVRISPGITFDPRFPNWAPSDFASQPDSVATFAYDAGGRQVSAINFTADVERSYLPNGALLTDMITVNAWDFGEGVADTQLRTYTYDLDGRRRAAHGLGGDTVAVDAAGRTTGIADPLNHWFRYQYDALGRPSVVTYPNGARLTRTYDPQDQVTRRIELDPAGSTLHNDTLTYDARGKVLHALGTVEEAYEGYSALGTLWASTRENVAERQLLENDEKFVADAMGNVVVHTVVRSNNNIPSKDSTVSTYIPLTGRLQTTVGLFSSAGITYTPSGARATSQGAPFSPTSTPATSDRYYYRADGLLIAVDHRACTLAHQNACTLDGQVDFEKPTGAFDEYRYDALGRRVLTRTLTDSVCGVAPCANAIMEVVFDGTQIAAEMRAPATVADSVAAGVGIGIPVPQPPNGAGAAFYGTVTYLNGPTWMSRSRSRTSWCTARGGR